MLRRMLMLAVPVVMLVVMNPPAQAHHSGAAYSQDQVTLKGTVVEYDWGNPHVVVVWDVKGDSGTPVRWSGELASVSSMLADGMTKNSLKPGDDVVMVVKPAKSGSPTSIIVQIKRADGTMVLGYSRRAGGQAAQNAQQNGQAQGGGDNQQ
jgi:hypothetical protein